MFKSASPFDLELPRERITELCGIHIYMYVYLYIGIYINTYINTFRHTSIHTHAHTHTHTVGLRVGEHPPDCDIKCVLFRILHKDIEA
jgi:hypothetical protein